MANALFEGGRNLILAGTVNWATGFGASGGIFAALHDCATTSAGVKAITGATNATPIAITCTAHGFANGDLVNILGVGGNLAANGIFQVSGQTTNAFNLIDPVTGANVVGSAAYTSGGIAVNLGPSFGTWASYSAGLVGSAVALSAETETQGIASAASVTFNAVSGNVAKAIILIATAAAGSLASTDKVLAFIDGRMIVTCAANAASSSTSIAVERLPAGIPNSTVLTFSNGASATMSALANQFDRTVSVTSTAALISAGNRADAPASASGLPVTPNGGNISITWDTVQGAGQQHAGIFKL